MWNFRNLLTFATGQTCGGIDSSVCSFWVGRIDYNPPQRPVSKVPANRKLVLINPMSPITQNNIHINLTIKTMRNACSPEGVGCGTEPGGATLDFHGVAGFKGLRLRYTPKASSWKPQPSIMSPKTSTSTPKRSHPPPLA